jgi:SP family general alpha glucoside:H+ symporter-like MFS transporter
MKINSFYGQPQFQRRFGEQVAPGKWAISANWQSGLSNSAVVGQLIGLVLNTEFQDRFGSRHTMMFFMVWLIGAIFVPFFAPSLPVLAVGEGLCGIPWGVFQVSRCYFDLSLGLN